MLRSNALPRPALSNSPYGQLNRTAVVLPMYRKHIEPFKKHADLVIDNGGDDTLALKKGAKAVFERIKTPKSMVL